MGINQNKTTKTDTKATSSSVKGRGEIIDSDRKQIRVIGKGNKYRYTLLSENTLDMLRVYWRAYRPKAEQILRSFKCYLVILPCGQLQYICM
jgi:site-specific recombinase XerD